MDDPTFYHHVNAERNDFFNWIKDVFIDEELASKVKKCKNKEEILKHFK